jgi:hypothetical protein
MRRFLFSFLLVLLSWTTVRAQTVSHPAAPPAINDFSGILSFLSSDWMEGREADARGGYLAADYIASMMQLSGLQPYGDSGGSSEPGSHGTLHRSYFQDFEVIRCRVKSSSLALIRTLPEGESALLLNSGTDYETDPVPFGREGEAAVVFAGYGIEAPGKGYNDYKGTDVRDRVVLILEGFPGHSDTTSAAWKKLGRTFGTEFGELSRKLSTAEKHRAIAVILISADEGIKPYRHSIRNQAIVNSAMDAPKLNDPDYDDPEYFLVGDTDLVDIPCFRLGADAIRLLLNGTGIDLAGFEKKTARDPSPASMALQGKKLRLSVAVEREAVEVRNVLGIIQGSDTGRNIIVGSHYDHLGTRNGVIYDGADDNASGVSGMLALSRAWAGHPEKPSCNIIFAAWTAEEKGLLGSDYFARHSPLIPDRLSVVINMDMISRSAPEDSAGRVLSIGTLPMNEDLKNLGKTMNLRLEHPFSLDLWDVTGHTGSDYAPFAGLRIPVMTFFSGFHDDYHTPGDVASKTDPRKMEEILKIVNDCIRETAENPPAKK